MTETPLLSVRNLSLGVQRKGRATTVIVDDISFDVAEGERFGIVGESGSGKSLTLRAIANLLPAGVKVLSGTIAYRGQDLRAMPAKSRRRLAGQEIAMIFQEPMTALNPVMRVGEQIAESPRRNLGLSKSAAMDLAIDMMRKTGIPDPAHRRCRNVPPRRRRS
jgi:ABC-type glutathione transport system ATPase component